MSGSHRTLALALVGVMVLFGLAKLVDDGPKYSAAADVANSLPGPQTTDGPITSDSITDEVDGDASTTTAATTADTVAAPVSTAPVLAVNADCPDTPHAAIVDRVNQRGALCDNGAITYTFPITTANSQPDPGTYPVYAKDIKASSSFGGHYSTMTHFVAFTRGKYKGARIAFHSVPTLRGGAYVQTLESVGTPEMHGQSSGCIRVVPDDSVKIWDWLAIGDKVRVIS